MSEMEKNHGTSQQQSSHTRVKKDLREGKLLIQVMKMSKHRECSNTWYFISVFTHELKCKWCSDGHSFSLSCHLERKLKNYVKINIIYMQLGDCGTTNNMFNAFKLNGYLGFWV